MSSLCSEAAALLLLQIRAVHLLLARPSLGQSSAEMQAEPPQRGDSCCLGLGREPMGLGSGFQLSEVLSLEPPGRATRRMLQPLPLRESASLTPLPVDSRPGCSVVRGTRGLADSSNVTRIVTGTHVMLAANFPAPPRFLLLLLYL